MKIKQVFHIISYLQYAIMLVVVYFYVHFILSLLQDTPRWEPLNNALVFLGIQIGFSTLQDTTKTQNRFSRKIWESARLGKIALSMMGAMTISFMLAGLIGFLAGKENIHSEISVGLIVIGLGLIGLLKTAIEMFDYHRKDKNNSGVK